MAKHLLIPYFNPNSGIGHITRCMRIATFLSSDILIEKQYIEDSKALFSKNMHALSLVDSRIISEPHIEYHSVIVDKQSVSKEEIVHWKQFGKTIGIDLGGEGREYADYLIDTMPNMYQHKANYYQLGLSVPSDIVVSDLGSRAIRKMLVYLHKEHLPYLKEIHEVCKSRYIQLHCAVANYVMQDDVKRLGIDCIVGDIYLYKKMHTYDIFVSHFGLSVFEALKAGISVITLNISNYHQKLSEMIPLPYSFQNNKQFIRFFECLDVQNYANLLRDCQNIIPKNNLSINGVLQLLLEHPSNDATSIAQFSHCHNPCLGLREDRAVMRSRLATVFKCSYLKYWYRYPFLSESPVYNSHYFNQDYASQYGKTYFEDMDHIKKCMKKRLQHIITLMHTKNKKDAQRQPDTKKPVLLDIGSGYHAMLDLAEEYNFTAIGTDINTDAIQYLQTHTKHHCFQSDISKAKWLDDVQTYIKANNMEQPSVICAWFTLEHIANLQHIIYAIHTLLPKKGILALSVPNAVGISAQRDFFTFCKESPNDHFSLFSPAGLSVYLKKHGFKVKKRVSTGIHLSRFPFSYILSPLWFFLAPLFSLGDTFELYVEKQ